MNYKRQNIGDLENEYTGNNKYNCDQCKNTYHNE